MRSVRLRGGDLAIIDLSREAGPGVLTYYAPFPQDLTFGGNLHDQIKSCNDNNKGAIRGG